MSKPDLYLDAKGNASANAVGIKRWLIVSILFIAVLSAFFDRINVAVLFTNAEFKQAIGVGNNPALLGLLMTVFLFAYGISAFVLSFLGDTKLGPRKTLVFMTVFWTVMMTVMGFANSFFSMLLSRALLGLFEGPQFSLSAKFVKRWFPQKEQGRANALWAIGTPVGSAIGFPLVIYIVAQYGWRSSFFVLAGFSLIIVLPLLLLVVRDHPNEDKRISAAERDYILQGQAEQKTSAIRSYKEDIKLFASDYRFWLCTLLAACYLSLLWGINSWLPSYLQEERHFNLASLGFFSSLPFWMMLVGELLGSTLSDRWLKRAPFCFVGMLGAAVFMYLVSYVENPITAALFMAATTFFLGLTIPVHFALLLKFLEEKVAATGYGVMNGIGNVVGAMAPLIMGLIISSTHSYNTGLMYLVIVSIIGCLSMLPLLRKH